MRQIIIPEFKIELQNKNKKIIKKVENLENIEEDFVKNNFKKAGFSKQNYLKRHKFRKKYNYHSKPKKNNFENKKSANF